MSAPYTPLEQIPSMHDSSDDRPVSAGLLDSGTALEDNPSPADAVKATDITDEGLRKEIGLFSASAIIVGQVIGSGIFSTPASVVFFCGTPAMALIL
ncbi:hypothetical protein EC988_009713, partial [Linderina pennispora]